jgi:hypothetical protein
MCQFFQLHSVSAFNQVWIHHEEAGRTLASCRKVGSVQFESLLYPQKGPYLAIMTYPLSEGLD